MSSEKRVVIVTSSHCCIGRARQQASRVILGASVRFWPETGWPVRELHPNSSVSEVWIGPECILTNVIQFNPDHPVHSFVFTRLEAWFWLCQVVFPAATTRSLEKTLLLPRFDGDPVRGSFEISFLYQCFHNLRNWAAQGREFVCQRTLDWLGGVDSSLKPLSFFADSTNWHRFDAWSPKRRSECDLFEIFPEERRDEVAQKRSAGVVAELAAAYMVAATCSESPDAIAQRRMMDERINQLAQKE